MLLEGRAGGIGRYFAGLLSTVFFVSGVCGLMACDRKDGGFVLASRHEEQACNGMRISCLP